MQLIKNNAFSTLAGALTNVATTMTVAAATGDRFPIVAAPDFCMVTLQDEANHIEIIKVTARASSSDSMTIERAQEGTAARAWNIGDIVEARVTEGFLNPLKVMEGASTASGIRTKLGATATGSALFTAADEAAARTAIGASDVTSALIAADDEAEARTAIGAMGSGDVIPTSEKARSAFSAAAGGTADAITATFAPNITVLTDGLRVRVKGLSPNTVTNPTLAAGTTAATAIKSAEGFTLAKGEIPEEGDFIYSAAAAAWLLQNSIPDDAMAAIAASVLTNALTATVPPCMTIFRSPTLTDGVPVRAYNKTAISAVVPNGATLGTSAGVAAVLAFGEIYVAGVKEAFICNRAAINGISENDLISTTAVSAGSGSASVIYSTTARAGVPWKVRGYITITEGIAGQWATPHTKLENVCGLGVFSLSKPTDFAASAATCTYTGSLVESGAIGVGSRNYSWSGGTFDLGSNRVVAGVRTVASDDDSSGCCNPISQGYMYLRGYNLKNN